MLVLGAVCTAMLLGAAAPAGATSVRVANGSASFLLAHAGWLSWLDQHTTTRLLLHAGRTTTLPADADTARFGTGPSGRPVELIERCVGRPACIVVRRDLATGAEVIVRSTGKDLLPGASEWRDRLVYAGKDSGVHSLRKGSRRAVRLTRDAGQIAGLNGRWLLYGLGPRYSQVPYKIKALDLRRHRTVVLVIDNGFDDDCRCTIRGTSISAPALDGNFAYWVVLTYNEGAMTPSNLHWFVYRADLRRPDRSPQFVEIADVPGGAQSLAVDNGAVFFSSQGQGVFRLQGPVWQTSPQRLPIRG
jgi:hypothetical protein